MVPAGRAGGRVVGRGGGWVGQWVVPAGWVGEWVDQPGGVGMGTGLWGWCGGRERGLWTGAQCVAGGRGTVLSYGHTH